MMIHPSQDFTLFAVLFVIVGLFCWAVPQPENDLTEVGLCPVPHVEETFRRMNNG